VEPLFIAVNNFEDMRYRLGQIPWSLVGTMLKSSAGHHRFAITSSMGNNLILAKGDPSTFCL
jgi:hypothetical protein